MWLQLFCVLLGVLVTFWFYPWDDKLDTLKGKRVIVTGSSDGIGEQIAYHYARLGASVVVTARRVEKLKEVVKECQTQSPSPNTKHFALPSDLSRLNDTKTLIDQAVKHLGGLDVLVLNHITKSPLGSFDGGNRQDLDSLQMVMDVNFRSYVFLTSHALSHLIRNNGSIIVVNSFLGKVPHPDLAAYSASKHALNGFFHSLKSQFRHRNQNVSVTSCTLGLIGTDQSMKELKRSGSDVLLKYFPPASPKDTALDIIKGGARRLNEIYTPYMETRPLVMLYGIWPDFVEFIMRMLSPAKNPKEASLPVKEKNKHANKL